MLDVESLITLYSADHVKRQHASNPSPKQKRPLKDVTYSMSTEIGTTGTSRIPTAIIRDPM